MACTSKYIYSNCTTLTVGCTLYSDNSLQTNLGAGFHKIPVGTGQKTFTTNSNGEITAEAVCSWSASYTYAPLFTSTKNNCVSGSCTVIGSTVTLNDGSPQNAYSGYATYTSFVSQSDADTQAQTAAIAMFEANKQDAVNSRGFCTFTFSSGSGTYSANFTKNNCASNCYANGTVNFSRTESNYSAQSTISCADAQSLANAAAYNAAVNYVNANGQANANANGSCCCWVAASTAEKCDGCNYRGNREKNQCTGAFRNDEITQYGSCSCGGGCGGTNYSNNYCSGADGKDRTYYETYNCGGNTGNSYVVNCGCNDGMTDRQSTNQTTCVGCINTTIFLDVNRCSGTYLHYFVNGEDRGTTMPSTAACFTGTDYSAYKGVYCYAGINYDVYQDTNTTCSQAIPYQLRDRFGNVEGYNNNLGSAPCQFSAFRSGTFTRNNCPSGDTAGSVSYSNTYYYTGIKNQAGADEVADANFNNDGQNYANANASCTPQPTCYTYNIISNNSGVYVNGNYTTCGGSASSFSFYSSSAFTQVGTICAQAGSVSITANGFSSSSGGC